MQKFWRLTYITYILLKYGIDDIFLVKPYFRFVRWFLLLTPGRSKILKQKNRGERLREACTILGPLFVKLGQVLSTRVDLLPNDIIIELSALQDKVPPFCTEKAKAMITKALGHSLKSAFKSFETSPLASASIAQVHGATLYNGKEVVVKVLRPNIAQTIKNDIALLNSFAKILNRFKTFKPFKPKDFVSEFEKSILKELDLTIEAANASQLRRNLKKRDHLFCYVPKIEWSLTKKNILVMERIYGIPIHNLDALSKAKIDTTLVAKRLIETVFTQAFKDCFFHADVHPGNWLVDPTTPNNPTLICVDFGIMGTLTKRDQHYLASNLLAFLKRDYRRVAELHVESGWVKQSIRLDEFENAIREVSEPLLEGAQSPNHIPIVELLMRLFKTARAFQIDIQPQFILLQKTLFNLEGLVKLLSKEIDIFDTAKPVLESFIKMEKSPKALIQKLRQYAPLLIDTFEELPPLLYKTLVKMATP